MKSIPHITLFKGYTLVEVMIATVILGVGLVGVAQFQGSMMKGSAISKQRIEALNFAENWLDNLRHFTTMDGSNGWNSKVLGSLSGTALSTDSAYQSGGSPMYSMATYTLTYQIAPSTDGSRADISVNVTWPNAAGQQSDDTKVSLATVLSEITPLPLASSQGGDFKLPPLPVIEVPDPTLNSNNIPNGACNCDQTNGVVAGDFRIFAYNFMNGFVKVGGMMGGGNTMGGMSSGMMSGGTLTQTGTECTLCCSTVYAQLDEERKYYAALMLKEFMQDRASFEQSKYDDRASYEQARYEDRVIDNRQIDERYLIKSYHPKVWNKINNYIKVMAGHGGSGCSGMMCTASSMTYGYAYCTYITPPSGTMKVMMSMNCN